MQYTKRDTKISKRKNIENSDKNTMYEINYFINGSIELYESLNKYIDYYLETTRKISDTILL